MFHLYIGFYDSMFAKLNLGPKVQEFCFFRQFAELKKTNVQLINVITIPFYD